MYYIDIKAAGEVARTASLTAITPEITSLSPTLIMRAPRATRAVPAQQPPHPAHYSIKSWGVQKDPRVAFPLFYQHYITHPLVLSSRGGEREALKIVLIFFSNTFIL